MAKIVELKFKKKKTLRSMWNDFYWKHDEFVDVISVVLILFFILGSFIFFLVFFEKRNKKIAEANKAKYETYEILIHTNAGIVDTTSILLDKTLKIDSISFYKKGN